MNKKILVIEDDPSTLRFVEYTLQQEGLQVFTARNGLDGLKSAQTQQPDLIILDIMLPASTAMKYATGYARKQKRQASLFSCYQPRRGRKIRIWVCELEPMIT